MTTACTRGWHGPGIRGQERPPYGDDLGPVQDPSAQLPKGSMDPMAWL